MRYKYGENLSISKKYQDNNPAITFRMKKEEKEKIEQLAENRKQSVSHLVRESLLKAQKDYSDAYGKGHHDGFNDGSNNWAIWFYCCDTYNYTHLNEKTQTISLQFDSLYISEDIWSLQYNNSFKIRLYLYYEWQEVDDAEYITNPYNYSMFPEPDVTPPTISNIFFPDYVGIDHPGNISVDISDNNLYQVYMTLSDDGYITFNQSLVIWYYLNDSGLNGTYSVRDYSGTYAKLQQGNKSDSVTYFILSNWTASGKIHTLGYFLKNQTAELVPVFVEFNLSGGTVYNIAMYSSSESGKDMIIIILMNGLPLKHILEFPMGHTISYHLQM